MPDTTPEPRTIFTITLGEAATVYLDGFTSGYASAMGTVHPDLPQQDHIDQAHRAVHATTLDHTAMSVILGHVRDRLTGDADPTTVRSFDVDLHTGE